MARKPSVILTPTEKKAAAADVKNQLKASMGSLKTAESARKALDKKYAADVKALAKAYETAVKASDKEQAGLNKEVAQLTAKHTNLVPMKAVPSPTN